MAPQDQPLSHSNCGPKLERRHSAKRTLGAALGCALALFSLPGCQTKTATLPAGLEPAKNFSAYKFEGTWHEIARTNNPEERGLTHVSANYRRTKDGSWLVTSRGWSTAEGRWLGSTRKATLANSLSLGTAGSFSLGFHKPRHVVVVDNEHTMALVCGRTYREFWLLSKSQNPEQARVERMLTLAKDYGFPVSEAFFVPTR